MTIEEMKERKRQLGYTNEQIADLSNVPLSTVQKVFSGATQAPRYETLRAIERVLTKQVGMLEEEQRNVYGIREATPQYGKGMKKMQGEYTLADYYAWPEEERIELIDGVIYNMSAPLLVHQAIVGEIAYTLKDYVKKNKGTCMVFEGPIDVQLDCDNKTMIQPDILVVCGREKFGRKNILGAPDMVVEVLSPNTRRKDMTIKLSKYAGAGVREYWMVDPERENIIVYDIENDMIMAVYTFKQQVPVRIFHEECVVDFQEIKEYVSSLGVEE